jgi:hypothetical protein
VKRIHCFASQIIVKTSAMVIAMHTEKNRIDEKIIAAPGN